MTLSAPLGSKENPIHSNQLNKLVDATDYRAASGKQWARTVAGTAFHALLRDYMTLGRNGVSLDYFNSACVAERDGVEFGREQTPEFFADMISEWRTAIKPRLSELVDGPCFCEWSFLMALVIDGVEVWYEGTTDVLSRLGAIDYKTGSKGPDARISAQHHLYCLGVLYGVWSNPRHFPDRHQLDWTTATEPFRHFGVFPQFRYIHVPRMVGSRASGWNILACATDGNLMSVADSTRYITELTRKLLSQQPVENQAMNPQQNQMIPAQTTAITPRVIAGSKHELTAQDILEQGRKIQDVMRQAMKLDEDYGIIPGTSRKDKDGNEKAKPTLLKPGAEKLLLLFRLAPEFNIDKTADGSHRDIFVRCRLTHIPTGEFMGEGVGECSTRETKYAWRQSDRKCPKCEQSTMKKFDKKFRDPNSGKEWVCYEKSGGCGARFAENDTTITGQEVGRKPNPDIADTYNTVTKMACKRALVMAVLNCTGASFMFTQDLEDFADYEPQHQGTVIDAPQPQPQREANPVVETPAPAAFGWGKLSEAQKAPFTRLHLNLKALGYEKEAQPAQILAMARALYPAINPASAADIDAKIIGAVIGETEKDLDKRKISRPERPLTPEEQKEAAIREVVGEFRTASCKAVRDLFLQGAPIEPQDLREIIDNRLGEGVTPGCKMDSLGKENQELVAKILRELAEQNAAPTKE